jgi:uncharacterized protein
VKVVSDSSPLISLAKIDLFDLLRKLYGTVSISAEVYAEVAAAGSGLPGSSEVSGASWIAVTHLRHAVDLTAAQERFRLGIGELSTLILAKEIGADFVGVFLNRDLLNRSLDSFMLPNL